MNTKKEETAIYYSIRRVNETSEQVNDRKGKAKRRWAHIAD